MKKALFFAVLGLFSASALTAADSDVKGEVKAAAKKLGDASSYSWISTPKWEGGPGGGGGGGNFRPGATHGVTEKGGATHLKTTMGERTSESVMKGEKVAVLGQDGWQSEDELEGNRQFMARRIKTLKAPAAEAADLADKAKSLKKSDGVISGELTEDAVKELLAFGRRPGGDSDRPAPKNAKGTVKFWTKDGELTKYEYQVQGTVSGRDDQEFDINRTTTIEIKDVGKAKVALPEEAKKKIS